MTKYEIIAESLQEKVNSGELTLEDARILNDVAYENYSHDDTEYEVNESFLKIEEAADYVSEGIMSVEEACDYFEITEKTGNNAVIRQVAKKNKETIKKKIKEIKEKIKNKKYDDADKCINEVIEEFQTMKKTIKEIETDDMDDLISFVEKWGLTITKSVIDELNMVAKESEKTYKTIYEELGEQSVLNDIEKIKNHIVFIALSTRIVGFAKKKIRGEETNEKKLKALKSIDKAIKTCDSLKKQIKLKKKFDEYSVKIKNKKKLIVGGALIAGAVAVGSGIGKKKEAGNESKKKIGYATIDGTYKEIK